MHPNLATAALVLTLAACEGSRLTAFTDSTEPSRTAEAPMVPTIAPATPIPSATPPPTSTPFVFLREDWLRGLVFRIDRELWIFDELGDPQLLVELRLGISDIDVSADGTRLVY